VTLKFLTSQPRQPHLPLLIYFPGMDGTGVLFARQQEQLARHFDVCCLAISRCNLLGWDELVNGVLALIDRELAGGEREIHLCGESFGACLAMMVATQLPQIQQLISINPASSFAKLPLLAMGSFGVGIVPQPLYQLSARLLVSLLIEIDRVAQIDRQNLIRAMLSIDSQTVAWRLKLLREFQINLVLPDLVDVPTLLLAGERDRLLPSKLEVQTIQRQLPRSKTILLPYSGHACLLEKDINLAQIIL
jgi:pimeloyl-ACP methyl ester carboxylesterase